MGCLLEVINIFYLCYLDSNENSLLWDYILGGVYVVSFIVIYDYICL